MTNCIVCPDVCSLKSSSSSWPTWTSARSAKWLRRASMGEHHLLTLQWNTEWQALTTKQAISNHGLVGGGGVGVCAGDKFVVRQNPDKRPSYDHVGWLNYCFTSTETVVSLGTGAQDVHLDFHTAPELWLWPCSTSFKTPCALQFCSYRSVREPFYKTRPCMQSVMSSYKLATV